MNTSYVERLCEALLLVKQEVKELNKLMVTLEKIYGSFMAGHEQDFLVVPFEDHQRVEVYLGSFRNGAVIEYCALIEDGNAVGRRIDLEGERDREILKYTAFSKSIFTQEILGELINVVCLENMP